MAHREGQVLSLLPGGEKEKDRALGGGDGALRKTQVGGKRSLEARAE